MDDPRSRLLVPSVRGDRPEGPRPLALVVDDDRHVREVLTLGLMIQGFDVCQAEDGTHAIEACKQHGGRIVIALVDKRMPEPNGIKTIQALRAMAPQMRCWLMTADGDIFTAGELSQMGAEGFLRKPFALAEVADAIRGMPGS